eukprot:c10568_g1_i1.p1 GENE.c10568_g1_i1~~c10568_g1_i1.p1  ORF type:complete len:898 (-),score=133.74 c10568_g1_i1:459-3152(-)
MEDQTSTDRRLSSSSGFDTYELTVVIGGATTAPPEQPKPEQSTTPPPLSPGSSSQNLESQSTSSTRRVPGGPQRTRSRVLTPRSQSHSSDTIASKIARSMQRRSSLSSFVSTDHATRRPSPNSRRSSHDTAFNVATLAFDTPHLENKFLQWYTHNVGHQLKWIMFEQFGITSLAIIPSICTDQTRGVGLYAAMIALPLAAILVLLFPPVQHVWLSLPPLAFQLTLALYVLVLTALHVTANAIDYFDTGTHSSLLFVLLLILALRFRLRFIVQFVVSISQVCLFVGFVELRPKNNCYGASADSQPLRDILVIIGITGLVLAFAHNSELRIRADFKHSSDLHDEQTVLKSRVDVFKKQLTRSSQEKDDLSSDPLLTPLEQSIIVIKRLHDAPGTSLKTKNDLDLVVGLLAHMDADTSLAPTSDLPLDSATRQWLQQERVIQPHSKSLITRTVAVNRRSSRIGSIVRRKTDKRETVVSALADEERPAGAASVAQPPTTPRINSPRPNSPRPNSHSRSPSNPDTSILTPRSDVSSDTWRRLGFGQRLGSLAASESSTAYPEQNLDADSTSRIKILLSKIDEWNFPIFELDELSHHHPLYFMALAVFDKRDFFNALGIDRKTFQNFLLVIEANYQPNPYHNAIHAADVLQTNHYFLLHAFSAFPVDPKVVEFYIFCSCLAAIVHDYEHNGVNNDFLIRSRDTRALVHNDRAPQENHHLAAAFACLGQQENNFLSGFSFDRLRDLRRLVIDLVLGTDMAQHAAVMSSFRVKLGSGALTELDEDMVVLVLKMALKCSDVSHTAKEDFLHSNWTQRVTEEFFLQGDLERNLGMQISPFMDRNNPQLGQSQLGFFQYLVQPLFDSFSQYLQMPDAPFMLYIRQHRLKYERIRQMELNGETTGFSFQ